jgi:hypothetical protein
VIYYPKNVGVNILLNSRTIWEARCEVCKTLPLEFGTDAERQEWAEAHAVDHLRWTLNAAGIDRAAVGRAMPGETTHQAAQRVGRDGKTHYIHNDRVYAVGREDLICYANDLEG